jgi:hypothetical protein
MTYCFLNINRLRRLEYILNKPLTQRTYLNPPSAFVSVLSTLYLVTNKLQTKENFLYNVKLNYDLTPAEFVRIERIVSII